MPRTAKRTQPATAPQDQGYGIRGEQIAAQGAMPLPDNRSLPAETPMEQAPQPGATGMVTSPQQLLEMLKSQAPPPAGGLARPSDRPAEPLTTGLGQPDPTPMPAQNKAADVLDQIAATTGDERFAALAQRARVV